MELTSDFYDCTDQRFTMSFILTATILIVHFDVSKTSYNILFYEAAVSQVGTRPRLRPHTRKSKLKKECSESSAAYPCLYATAIEIALEQ